MYDRILVPLDGSPTSDRGFEEAVALARALESMTGRSRVDSPPSGGGGGLLPPPGGAQKSCLVLLHVMDFAPIPVEAMTQVAWDDIAEGLRQQAQTLLDRAKKTATEHGVRNELLLIEARGERVADCVVRAALETKCDLVVMGTHGRRGFAHAFLGSDVERVLRQCPVPVLVVRHPQARRA